MTGLMTSIFFACGDDDDGVGGDDGIDLLPPTIEATAGDPASVVVGATTTITYTVTAPGGFQSATASTNDDAIATAEVTTDGTAGEEDNTVVVTVTGVGEGTTNVTLEVEDEQDQSASDDVEVTVSAGDGDGGDSPAVATAGAALDTAADETLTTLAAAVEAAGLTTTLDDADQVTIFAPNNAAFTALLTGQGLEDGDLEGLIEALTADGVSNVLQAHVVADSLGAEEVIAAADGDSLTTLQGALIGVSTDADGNVFVNGAQIVQADIVVGNGVIHVIDSVINTNVAGEEGEDDGEDMIVPDPSQVDENDAAREVALELIDNFNAVQDVGVSLTNPVPNANLDFVNRQLAEYPDDVFDEVDYKGAFDPSGTSWLEGWSLLSRGGYLGGTASGAEAYSTDELGEDDANVVELSGTVDATGGYSMTADQIYKIDGYTFIENGELTIEAGTRVIAETEPTTGDDISALIITRSATINAQGTAENPIIMTSENDNESGVLDENSAGEWGGLIILGEARVNKGGVTLLQIEGIPSNIEAQYGAADGNFVDDDNSGTLRYVSIRYTGDALSSGDELQGLTLGGVGSGTTIEYVESFASSDDGIEIFGGSPDIKYFAVGFAQDDSYDFDLGFNGNIQFAYALQGQSADNLIEWDGADNDNNEVFSDPTLYNMTLVGTAIADQALVLRDNTAGVLANSIIVSNGTRGIVVEDLPGDDVDSYQRLIDGEIELSNNLWFLGDTFVEFNSTDAGVVQTVVPD